ncbi:MAG TPA: hypothetical protein VJ654_00790 [Noviherbaspirillum sp.]|nr:hypothetical protein [Noviherbaspirillum sp.]
MESPDKSVFEYIQGVKAVDPQELAAFRKAMTEQVIPEIVRIIEDRSTNAAQMRSVPLTR